MRDEFEIYDPKKFFEMFVKRAYVEYLNAPLDHYRAKMAVTNADVLAERVWKYYHATEPAKVANAKAAIDYRRFLVANESADFQLIWDVHDGHKHVELTRKPRQVTSAAQTGLRRLGGAFGSGAFGVGPFGTGKSEMVIRLDDGKEQLLSSALKNVVDMWERVLSRL